MRVFWSKGNCIAPQGGNWENISLDGGCVTSKETRSELSENSKLIKSVQGLFWKRNNQMLVWGVNVIPPVMTITFNVIMKQTADWVSGSYMAYRLLLPTPSFSWYIISIVADCKSLHSLWSLCLFSCLLPPQHHTPPSLMFASLLIIKIFSILKKKAEFKKMLSKRGCTKLKPCLDLL